MQSDVSFNNYGLCLFVGSSKTIMYTATVNYSLLPSNIVQNDTLFNQTQSGHTDSVHWERETIIIATLIGSLLLLLLAIFVGVIVLVRRRKRRRRSVRLAGSVRSLEPHPIRRLSPPGIPQLLTSNVSYGVSHLLARPRTSSTSSRQSSESTFVISSNPSYCVFPESRPCISRTEDTASLHQYDDIIKFPIGDEGEKPSDIYDRLEPMQSPDYENVSESVILKQNATKDGEPCTPQPHLVKAPQGGNDTPLPRLQGERSQSSDRSQVRVSVISDGYVNEFDGPPSAYKPQLSSHSLDLNNDPGKSSDTQLDASLGFKREVLPLMPQLCTSASFDILPLWHPPRQHCLPSSRSSSFRPNPPPPSASLHPHTSSRLQHRVCVPTASRHQWMKFKPLDYEIPVKK